MLWLAALLVGGAFASLAPTTTAPTATPTTKAPTLTPTPFVIPSLPISKEGAQYPDCRAEIIFVLDVSSSVALVDQQTLMRFTVQFMVQVEKNVKDARFGVVIFGINHADTTQSEKSFNMAPFGGGTTVINGPMGNRKPVGTEVALSLDRLRYNCTECGQANAAGNFSQLQYMWSLQYLGYLTPTWDGLDMAKEEYDSSGDPTVPGRFIVLLTDGIPNDANCQPSDFNSTDCIRSINYTDTAVASATNGTLLLTVGMGLTPTTQPLMTRWASAPKDVLAVPSTDYDKLQLLIPKILSVLCPAGAAVDCLPEGATDVDIIGSEFNIFLNTPTLGCRFFRDNEDPYASSRYTRAQWMNNTWIKCPLPTDFFPGTWNLQYTIDGRGYYDGAKFKFGTVCRPELLVIWWPFCALALLPLAFCRAKRVAPATTTKVTRGVARPAPAATEEYEEYEEVEEIVAPPEPVNKWKVAPTAYIGFGRARMSVDWAGVAPESAPHEGVRKKVVKKVVSDHAPVPTAGPAGVPAPAAQEAPMETTTTTSRPPIVEEPDWVNSFMDKVASVVCCCCNKK